MWSFIILLAVLASPNAASVFEKWIDIGSLSKTYYIGSSEITWESALVKCLTKGHGVRLATISSEEEMNLLVNNLFQLAEYRIWIGIHRNASGNFTRLGPTQSDYFKWGVGEPNNEGNEECVELKTNPGVWNDVPCNIKKKYLCEADKEQETNTVCGEGYEDWKYYKGYCYLTGADHESAKNWESAESYCVQRNSHLVSIRDLTEQTFVFSKLLQKSHSLHNLWSGLKFNRNLSSTWIDGSPVAFSNLESEKHDTEGCISLNLLYKHWSVTKCSKKLGFVCKIPYELTKRNSTKDATFITQVTKVIEYGGTGGLTAGLIINIILTMIVLLILILVVKRWASDSNICLWFKSTSLLRWTKLKEEEVKEEP